MWLTKGKALAAALVALALLGSSGALLTYAARSAEQKKDDRAASDKEVLQGTWVAQSAERNGEKFTAERLKNWERLVFVGDKVSREGNQPEEGTYTLNPDKKPREIDLFADGDTWTGIYELKGTTLKMALRCGDERPTAFDAPAILLIVFEKKK
jgi:uncharacterized protein (TIGR03067 family)